MPTASTAAPHYGGGRPLRLDMTMEKRLAFLPTNVCRGTAQICSTPPLA